MWFTIGLCLVMVCSFVNTSPLDRPVSKRMTYTDYNSTRQQLLVSNQERGLGYNLILTEDEERANKIIMKYKTAEIAEGLANPYEFAPSRNLFEVLDKIKDSNLFKIIRKMPKGGILHAHSTAMGTAEFAVNLTKRENLWQCGDMKKKALKFQFAVAKPTSLQQCDWELVSEKRRQMGNETYDRKVRKVFTLYTENPATKYKDINVVWFRFLNIFGALKHLLSYVPVWKEYLYFALETMYKDGVQYLEFRATISSLYHLNGTVLGPVEVVQIYLETVEKFKAKHLDFIGVKVIYAPLRKANNTVFETYITKLLELHKRFPEFLVGFDLVGQEDNGRPLKDFVQRFLGFPETIKFFFHAGETNWNGLTSDENLIDAILLGTKRIGHGYALVKHPKLMELLREKDIAVEINPISNQILKLVNDLRNHPASILFSDNYPVVVSSDDPPIWEATPLSHDFYEAFLGIASAHQDLRVLKKLALNSLEYSSMNATELVKAKSKWSKKWNIFIKDVIKQESEK